MGGSDWRSWVLRSRTHTPAWYQEMTTWPCGVAAISWTEYRYEFHGISGRNGGCHWLTRKGSMGLVMSTTLMMSGSVSIDRAHWTPGGVGSVLHDDSPASTRM